MPLHPGQRWSSDSPGAPGWLEVAVPGSAGGEGGSGAADRPGGAPAGSLRFPGGFGM